MTVRILTGDALEGLRTLEAGSAQACVTSPPYWGQRDYGVAGQIGAEPSPEEFVEKLVAVFAEVRRVLHPRGTLWLNLGDCYANNARGPGGDDKRTLTNHGNWQGTANPPGRQKPWRGGELKKKDLVGLPWRVAFALQADGWWLRSCIIWAKPNGMPESVTDRPTTSHEYVFLLTKAERYLYNAEAIKSPAKPDSSARNGRGRSEAIHHPGQLEHKGLLAKRDKQRGHGRRRAGFNDRWDAMTREEQLALGANARTVWTISPACYKGAHFAVMPEELAARCIRAGTNEGHLVIDPFGGAGTVGLVAQRLFRHATLIELNPAFVSLAAGRIRADQPLLADVQA